jgi:hypothetical protein
MLVAPEQESGDADDLVVAELDQATRSVADLRRPDSGLWATLA